MRSLVIFMLGCFLAGSLSACSGERSGTSVMPQNTTAQSDAHKPAGELRHKHSGCTPDSYGYCVVLLGTSFSDKIDCGYPNWHWGEIVQRYELYYNNVAQGEYDKTTWNTSCDGSDPSITWNPADPADVTGDPNLP